MDGSESSRLRSQPACLECCVTADRKTVPDVSSPDGPQAPKLSGSFAVLTERDGAQTDNRESVNIWFLRIRVLLYVTLCATFGVLLLILPWTPKWTDNPLLLKFPQLRQIVSSGFVRGVSTGLGVLDLWLGFWEAIHYHEGSRSN